MNISWVPSDKLLDLNGDINSSWLNYFSVLTQQIQNTETIVIASLFQIMDESSFNTFNSDGIELKFIFENTNNKLYLVVGGKIAEINLNVLNR